jgi:Flp pilus assembly protein TadG
MVEFALVIPIFAVLLFALVDSGLAFSGFITMRNGVDAGGRMASVSEVDPSCTSSGTPMLCTVQKRLGSILGITASSVQVGIALPPPSAQNPGAPAAGTTGANVKVCAVATLHSTTGLTPFINGRVVHATSIVRLEHDATYAAGGLTC